MRKQFLNTITLTSSVALAAMSGAVSASENPFSVQTLQSGYQLADAHSKMKEGSCGEGTCGATKGAAKKADGNCGGDKKAEGSCGGDKKAEGGCGGKKADASCGGDKKADGGCGGKKADASCGGDKK